MSTNFNSYQELFQNCVLYMPLYNSSDDLMLPTRSTTPNGSIAYTSLGNGRSAITFDGTNKYLSIPSTNVLPLSGNWTISFWFNLSSLSDVQMLFTMYNSNAPRFDIWLYSGPVRISFCHWPGTGATQVISNAISFNTWYHFTVTYISGGLLTLYIDGILTSTNTPATINYTASDGLELGRQAYYSSSRFYNGKVSDLMVFKGVALPQSIVRYLAINTHPINKIKQMYPNIRGIKS